MCNKNSILLMSNYTEAIFVVSLVRRRRLTPFWFWIFSTTVYVRSQFFPYFFDILAHICPRCLLCVFVTIYVEFCAISVKVWRLLASNYLVQEERFSTKLRVGGTSSKWRQMTIVCQKIPVCIMFDHLYTKVKISFYCPNEVFLPLFLTQLFLLLLYF